MTLGESSAPERNCCTRDTQNIERVLFALSPGFLGEIISDFLSLLHQLIGVAAHIFYFFFKLYLFVLWQFKYTWKALVTSKSKYRETCQLLYFYGSTVILRGNAPSMHCSELLIILRLVLEVAKCETLGRPKWGH